MKFRDFGSIFPDIKMETIEIEIKFSGNISNPKDSLLKLCHKKLIKIAKITPIKGGFILIVNNDQEALKLFQSDIINVFENVGFKAKYPELLKSKHTIIGRNFDKSILDHSFEEIKNEINNKNEGITVSEVFPCGYASLKFILSDIAMVERILNRGIQLFYLSHRNFQKDVYVKLINCKHCGAIEQHVDHLCPDKSAPKCVKCSATTHTKSNCSQNFLKCLNCHSNHHTLAMKCPIRKKIVSEKRKELQRNNSFANVTKPKPNFVRRSSALVEARALPSPGQSLTPPPSYLSFPPPPISPPIFAPPILPPLPSIKISALLQISLLNELETPGCFPNVFNDLLKANGLCPLELGFYKIPGKETIASFLNNDNSANTKIDISSNSASVGLESSASECPVVISTSNDETEDNLNASSYTTADSDSDSSLIMSPPKITTKNSQAKPKETHVVPLRPSLGGIETSEMCASSSFTTSSSPVMIATLSSNLPPSVGAVSTSSPSSSDGAAATSSNTASTPLTAISSSSPSNISSASAQVETLPSSLLPSVGNSATTTSTTSATKASSSLPPTTSPLLPPFRATSSSQPPAVLPSSQFPHTPATLLLPATKAIPRLKVYVAKYTNLSTYQNRLNAFSKKRLLIKSGEVPILDKSEAEQLLNSWNDPKIFKIHKDELLEMINSI